MSTHSQHFWTDVARKISMIFFLFFFFDFFNFFLFGKVRPQPAARVPLAFLALIHYLKHSIPATCSLLYVSPSISAGHEFALMISCYM